MKKNTLSAGFGHIVIVIVLVIVVALLGALSWVFFQNFVGKDSQSNVASISNFDECKSDPGSTIQESYPERCVTADGRAFTNPDTTAYEDSTYCTQAEKLCFDVPTGWTVSQVEREEDDTDPSNTDMLSVISPDSSMLLHLTTGIDGLGGTCDPNDTPYTVVKSIPTALTGYETNEFFMETAHVVQLVSNNINNYVSSLYLSVTKSLENAGDSLNTCNLMFSNVIPGKYSHPFDDTSDQAGNGSFTFFASQSPYGSGLSGDDPEFSTKSEAAAIFDTDVYKQATNILSSVRYQE